MYEYEKILLQSHGPVSIGLGMHRLLPLKSIERCLVFVLQVPEQAPQLSHTVQDPSTENFNNIIEHQLPNYYLHKIKKHLPSQGPVSLELPAHGKLPL